MEVGLELLVAGVSELHDTVADATGDDATHRGEGKEEAFRVAGLPHQPPPRLALLPQHRHPSLLSAPPAAVVLRNAAAAPLHERGASQQTTHGPFYIKLLTLTLYVFNSSTKIYVYIFAFVSSLLRLDLYLFYIHIPILSPKSYRGFLFYM